MVYSGGEKHQYGVGILMKKEIANSMTGFWPVSERLIMVKLKGKPFDVNIIQVYAPTQDHTENEIEEFYENLQQLMKYTKSCEMNMAMGDLNAKIRKGAEDPVVGNYGLGTRNERGSKLIEFCKGNNLIIMNTMFKHHPKNIYTWKSPGDVCRNQIDYIMINDRFKNSVKNVKTHPGADIDSDHNPVVMNLKLKLKIRQKPRVHEQYNLNMLKEENIKMQFNFEVKNKFSVLKTEDSIQTDELEENWENMKQSFMDASKKVLPKKEKKAKQSWMTDEILNLMDERKSEKHRDPEKYETLRKRVETECKTAKEIWWNKKCEDIELLEAMNRHKEMHDRVKEVTGNQKEVNVSQIRMVICYLMKMKSLSDWKNM